MKQIFICLEKPGPGMHAAAFRAAAATMRASLYLARSTLVTDELAPLAAVLARATARPRGSERPDDERKAHPEPGAVLPISGATGWAEGSEDMQPFLAAMSQHWTSDASELHREKSLPSVELCVMLTRPTSDRAAELMRRAERVLTFERLGANDEWSFESPIEYLDRDWSPTVTVDPETGRESSVEGVLPPFGLLLQQSARQSPA